MNWSSVSSGLDSDILSFNLSISVTISSVFTYFPSSKKNMFSGLKNLNSCQELTKMTKVNLGTLPCALTKTIAHNDRIMKPSTTNNPTK